MGIDQYRTMNRKGVEQHPDPFHIEVVWSDLHRHGDTAWVECETVWRKSESARTGADKVRLTTILKKVNGRWLVTHVHGSTPDYRLHDGEYMLRSDMRRRNLELERLVAERTMDLQRAKEVTDDLLRNILPASVVEELRTHGRIKARLHPETTVLFADFKNFTQHSELLSPQELVDELNECFTAFDSMLGAHRIEKIKTVGDAYLAASGLPERSPDHAIDAVSLALEIRDFIEHRKARLGDRGFGIRIGVHSGEVVAGIVGIRKFAYDIWGDTVNTAARLQESCVEGHVNISSTTHELVKDRFQCTYRGELEVKNKAPMKMYFAEPRTGNGHARTSRHPDSRLMSEGPA